MKSQQTKHDKTQLGETTAYAAKSDASKQRSKELKRLGYEWFPSHRGWAWLFGNVCGGEAMFWVTHVSPASWQASARAGHATADFDCPLTAAIWLEVEYANEFSRLRTEQARSRALNP